MAELFNALVFIRWEVGLDVGNIVDLTVGTSKTHPASMKPLFTWRGVA